MKHPVLRPLFIVFFIFSLAPVLSGQNPLFPERKAASVQQDTVSAPVLPYPVSDISMESVETLQLVMGVGSNTMIEMEVVDIKTGVDSMFVVIDTFLTDTLFRSFKGLKGRNLDNVDNRISIYLNQISVEQEKLSKRYQEMEADHARLDAVNARWQVTKDQSAVNRIPEVLEERIDKTLGSIDSVANILQTDMQKILVELDRLLARQKGLLLLKENVQAARLALSESMFQRNMPGLFKDLANLKEPGLFRLHIGQIMKTVKTDVELFRTEFSGAGKGIIFLFIVLISFFVWYRKNHDRIISADQIELTALQRRLIESPFLVTFFTAGIIVRFAFPEIPFTGRVINILVLIIPLVILSIRFFGKTVRTWIYWLIAIYALSLFYELFFAPDILQRILLFFLSVATLVLYGWMLVKKPSSLLFKTAWVYKLLRNTLIGFITLLLVAILANLVGAFSLAEFLTLVPLQITFLLLAVKIVTMFTDLLVYMILASKTLQRVNAIREFFTLIHRKVSRIVSLFFWIFFVVRVMKLLRIKVLFFDWGEKLLNTGRMIGEVEISLRNILIFVFVIWLSLFITKIVRYILERDVFVRVSTSKGIPGTIIMLVRIALITGGFLLAAAAAGMELTNLSIVLGAFSVGIGFGLQNIFNNMVSGLILAFERPINVGDTVQVGELMGNVLNIGLRASRIKSFDGAEVIVPNGNLISDNVINWTLSDAYRRMDMRVGVAYGTDPRLVIQIIQEVAEAHPLVRQEPPVRALFIGFGDSSLDFRLLAWVDIENRLDVESDLNTDINAKLKEAGVEIPFPQRDLHIRSDSTKPLPGSAGEK